MAVITQWEGKFQKGVTENILSDYEQSLPIGSFAELTLHVSGPDWVNIRQKMADNIERDLRNAGYAPWPDNKRLVFCSLINPTITVKWTVAKGSAEYYSNFKTGDFHTGVAAAPAAPAFVIWIVAGILIALFAAFAINYFKMKAYNQAGGLVGGSPVPFVSAIGIAAIAGYFVYLYWLQKVRKKQ